MDRRPAKGFFRDDYFYAANRFATAEHGGTHIDAPIHFFANRETVDQIPLSRLIGPGVWVDVSDRWTSVRTTNQW
jgi:kynurenine formamidase